MWVHERAGCKPLVGGEWRECPLPSDIHHNTTSPPYIVHGNQRGREEGRKGSKYKKCKGRALLYHAIVLYVPRNVNVEVHTLQIGTQN